MQDEDYFIQKYKYLKESMSGKKPLRAEFLKFCDIHERSLIKIFGRDPYSKLQQAYGDVPNKLELERTPLIDIVANYGELVRKVGNVPVSADWVQANYSPQPDGLRKVHNLKGEICHLFLLNIAMKNPNGVM